jgi:chromosome segregation ATPase
MEETDRPNETKPALPREWEMIVTAFMPNLKMIENRFDRIDIDIRELHVGQKDISSRMNLLEKRMDLFETQVDKRFEQLTGEFRDFKTDTKWRFEQVDKRFEQLTGELRDFKADVKWRFEQVDKRFEQVDKRFEGIDHRLEQIVASIDRLGDKIDARDARQRSFTLRMFGIAITISFLGVLGVLVKTFGLH